MIWRRNAHFIARRIPSLSSMISTISTIHHTGTTTTVPTIISTANLSMRKLSPSSSAASSFRWSHPSSPGQRRSLSPSPLGLGGQRLSFSSSSPPSSPLLLPSPLRRIAFPNYCRSVHTTSSGKAPPAFRWSKLLTGAQQRSFRLDDALAIFSWLVFGGGCLLVFGTTTFGSMCVSIVNALRLDGKVKSCAKIF